MYATKMFKDTFFVVFYCKLFLDIYCDNSTIVFTTFAAVINERTFSNVCLRE